MAGKGIWLCLAGGLLGLAGCGGKELPVAGHVTLNDQPLTRGMVAYTPDESKGNTSKAASFGSIGPDGTYTLMTGERPGAAPGWYRVTVQTSMPANGAVKGSELPRVVALNPQYQDAKQTPLRVEVVSSPGSGHYNLKLKK